MKDKSNDGVFDWNVTGASICYLGLEVHFLSQSCMKLYACLQFYMLTSLLIMGVAHEKFEYYIIKKNRCKGTYKIYT
jgi:hypothetical protein